MYKRIITLLLIAFLSANIIYSQNNQLIKITESDPWNPTEIQDWVLNILHGGGGVIDTNSITFTGNSQQLGRFQFGETSIGMDTGIVISTGQVMQIQSYNTLADDSYDFNGPPDADLDSIYSQEYGLPINPVWPPPEKPYTGDAAVIEFEYTPYGDIIWLSYVFGSEEYPYMTLGSPPPGDIDYTGLTPPYSLEEMFDIFAIGIGRPNAGFKNIAKVNEFTGAVDVNVTTVNFNRNDFEFVANPGASSSYGVQFDGFTKPSNGLRIRKEAEQCTKYKIKIAIEDFLVPDPRVPEITAYNYNSGLFLGGGSLIGGVNMPSWTTEHEYTNPAAVLNGKLIEGGCNELIMTFTLDYIPADTFNNYYIGYVIPTYKDKIEIRYLDDNSPVIGDSVIIPKGEITRSIILSAVNIDANAFASIEYSIDPCDRIVPQIGAGYDGKIEFELVDNEPFSYDPPLPLVFEAYCKEVVEITKSDLQNITDGGVEPISFIWPGGELPPPDNYFHTVNASPDFMNVSVTDLCDNESTLQIRFDNKPIILDQIQQIFLCGPGQSATVPVPVIIPNPVDYPGYSIEHVKWWKQGFPTPPLGDEDGDEITVVYDDVVGDNIWTCEYEIVDVCGGEADSSFTVNQSSLVLNDDGICSGDEVVLFTGTPAHWYEWYREEPGGGLTLIGNTQTTTDSNYPPGENEIRYLLKIEDNCGELQEAWMTVYVDIYEPQITLSPGDEICYGASITLEANEGATEYLWTQTGETTRSITLDDTEYQLGLNQYTVETVSSSDYYYCLNSASTEFTVYANPDAAFAIDPADHPCTNTDISFDYLGNEQNRTFLWDFGDGSPNDNNPHTVHQYTDAGTYYVNLFVEHTYPTGYKCSSDSTATVIVDPLPVAAFSPFPIEGCEPLDVTFTDNSVDVFPNATYDWTFGDGQIYSGGPGSVNHTYDSAGSYTVGLTVTNTERCFGSTSYQYIKVNPNPDADFIADPWVTTMDAPEIEFYNESNSEDILGLFEWDFDDNNGSNEENPTHTYIEPGLYNVYFRVETEKGCWDTIVKQVELSLYVKMYIPNAFSPNGDGLNDKFEIKGTPITDYHLYIYDRWGKQIWSTHNWENQWDGKDASGNIVPIGTYIYKITGTSPDPDQNYELGIITYQGTVTVTK